MIRKYKSLAILVAIASPVTSFANPALSTLWAFSGSDGTAPAGLVMDSAGNLYGATVSGGANGDGTVFELSGAGLQTLTTLVTFNGSNGSEPVGQLAIDPSGNLYGTTEAGGAAGDGTVFELSGASHQSLTTLVNFNGSNGNVPKSGLIFDPAGNLYGTTWGGGSGGLGTVYKLTGTAHQVLTTLANFSASTPWKPVGRLVLDSTGNIYGATQYGGTSSDGAVFELSGPADETLTPLASFNGSNGQNPNAGLAMDGQGNLYGTTFVGGKNNGGTIFELSGAAHSTMTTLFNLGSINGQYLSTGLTIDGAGDLFGMTESGGTLGDGTVFEVYGSNHQSLKQLVNFNLTNGSYPELGELVPDTAGNLYGTTTEQEVNGNGTVFELSGSGFVTSAVPEPSVVPTLAVALFTLVSGRRKRVQ